MEYPTGAFSFPKDAQIDLPNITMTRGREKHTGPLYVENTNKPSVFKLSFISLEMVSKAELRRIMKLKALFFGTDRGMDSEIIGPVKLVKIKDHTTKAGRVYPVYEISCDVKVKEK